MSQLAPLRNTWHNSLRLLNTKQLPIKFNFGFFLDLREHFRDVSEPTFAAREGRLTTFYIYTRCFLFFFNDTRIEYDKSESHCFESYLVCSRQRCHQQPWTNICISDGRAVKKKVLHQSWPASCVKTFTNLARPRDKRFTLLYFIYNYYNFASHRIKLTSTSYIFLFLGQVAFARGSLWSHGHG